MLSSGCFRTLKFRDLAGILIWTKLLELDCEVLVTYSENSLSFNRKLTSSSTTHLAPFRYLRNAGDGFVVTSCDKNMKVLQVAMHENFSFVVKILFLLRLSVLTDHRVIIFKS